MDFSKVVWGKFSREPRKTAPGRKAAPAPAAPSPAPTQGLTEFQFVQTECFALSDPGFGAVDEENQDMVLAASPLPGVSSRVVAGIFDGHGPEGRAVAVRIKERVLSVLAANADSKENIAKEEVQLCRAAHDDAQTSAMEDMADGEALPCERARARVQATASSQNCLQFIRSFMELETECIPIHSDSGACATVVVFDEAERCERALHAQTI